jgi:hypothetical protein
MIVLPCNQVVYFDVDDTLVYSSPTAKQLQDHGIQVEAPLANYIDDSGKFVESSGTNKRMIVPHRAHIDQLKKHAMRHHTIVVWSAGGEKWAAAAVKAMGLEQYVSLCICKPQWCYDDKQPQDFIPKPQYLEDYKDE